MTGNRAEKKALRARMAATGERYSVARRAVHQEPTAVYPHFVALVSGRLGLGGPGASVRDVQTGDVTDLVKPPPGAGHFTGVTSAGGGLFFLTCLSPIQSGRGPGSSPPRRVRRAPTGCSSTTTAGLENWRCSRKACCRARCPARSPPARAAPSSPTSAPSCGGLPLTWCARRPGTRCGRPAPEIARKSGAGRKKMRRFVSTKVPFSTELPL
jgi:hypothetical protein